MKHDERNLFFMLVAAIVVLGVIFGLCGYAAGQVTITPPPSQVDAGHPFLLRINGLTADELPRTAVAAEPRATTKAAIQQGPFGGQFIWCEADSPGQRIIVLAISTDQKPTILALVVQVGEQPNPPPIPPDPIPPPVPPPPGERKIVVIRHQENQTPAQAAVIHALHQYADQQGHVCRPADPDLENAQGESAPWLQPYLEAYKARKLKLPVLVIDAPAIGVVDSLDVVKLLPATGAEAIELVKKHGG